MDIKLEIPQIPILMTSKKTFNLLLSSLLISSLRACICCNTCSSLEEQKIQLTNYRLVSTKGHTYLNKPDAFRSMFVKVCMTFLWKTAVKRLKLTN